MKLYCCRDRKNCICWIRIYGNKVSDIKMPEMIWLRYHFRFCFILIVMIVHDHFCSLAFSGFRHHWPVFVLLTAWEWLPGLSSFEDSLLFCSHSLYRLKKRKHSQLHIYIWYSRQYQKQHRWYIEDIIMKIHPGLIFWRKSKWTIYREISHILYQTEKS